MKQMKKSNVQESRNSNTDLNLNENKSFNKQLKAITSEIYEAKSGNNTKNRKNIKNINQHSINKNNEESGKSKTNFNSSDKQIILNNEKNNSKRKSNEKLIGNNKRIRLHSNNNSKSNTNTNFDSNQRNTETNNRNSSNNQKNVNLKDLHESYELYSRSKNLYESYSSDFNLDKNKFKNSDFKWTLKLITEGTFEDKIGALSQHIKKNPKKTLNYLMQIIDLSKSSSIRHKLLCYQYLKDLFISSILENKKYLEFTEYLRYYKQINNTKNTPDNVLVDAFIEDSIHKLYNLFLVSMEENLKQDSILIIKKSVLEYFFELLKSKPEKEEYLLDLLIYKLGDPKTEISNQSLILIKKLQESHVNMSLVILKRIKAFINDENLCDENGCYHALTLISQFKVFKNEDYLKFGLNMFFKLFNIYTEKDNVRYHKHLDAVIKTITTLYKSAIQLGKEGGDSENVRFYLNYF